MTIRQCPGLNLSSEARVQPLGHAYNSRRVASRQLRFLTLLRLVVFLLFTIYLACLRKLREVPVNYNLGQNEMEKQTPFSQKPRIKPREGQDAPLSHP